jgi:hypothetical protein
MTILASKFTIKPEFSRISCLKLGILVLPSQRSTQTLNHYQFLFKAQNVHQLVQFFEETFFISTTEESSIKNIKKKSLPLYFYGQYAYGQRTSPVTHCLLKFLVLEHH